MGVRGGKEEKRRKPVPGIPILAGKSVSSGGMFMGVARVGARGPWARLASILGTQPAIIATLTAAFTVSAIGLKDMNDRRMAGEPYLHFDSAANIAAAADSPSALPGNEDYQSSLAMAARANAGAMGDAGAGGGEGVEDGEEAGDGEEEVEEAEGGALGSADGLAAMAEAAEEEEAKKAAAGEEARKKAEEAARRKAEMKLASARIGATRLSGGGGMASGIGRGFDGVAEKAGRSKALQGSRAPQVTRGKTSARTRGKTSLRGATARRLSKMNQAMGGAQKMGAAEASAVHKQQWDAAGAVGSSIGGAGSGVEGGGPTTGAKGAGVSDDGGPLGSNGDADGTGGEDVKDVGPSKNVTPWQKDMDMVMILLPIASLLLLASYLLAKAQMYQFAKMVAWAAAAVAAIVTLLGVKIMMMGQMMQGGMIAAIGALLTGLSVMAAMGHDDAAQAHEKSEALAADKANQSPLGKENFNKLDSNGALDTKALDKSAVKFDADSKTWWTKQGDNYFKVPDQHVANAYQPPAPAAPVKTP